MRGGVESDPFPSRWIGHGGVDCRRATGSIFYWIGQTVAWRALCVCRGVRAGSSRPVGEDLHAGVPTVHEPVHGAGGARWDEQSDVHHVVLGRSVGSGSMSLLASSGFALGRRTGQCASTGRLLQPGEEVVTVLIEPAESGPGGGGEPSGQPAGFQRLDYGLDAWEQGARPAGGSRIFAYWRGVQPEAGRSQRQIVSDEELVELFVRSGEGAGKQDDRQLVFRYLLALLLIRRRLLSVLSTRRVDGRDLMQARLRGRPDEVLQIADPGLDEETLLTETEALMAVIAPDADGQGEA